MHAVVLPLVESTLAFRFPHAPRSERAEAVKAVVAVMLGRTDIVSSRIGRPSRQDRRRFDGLTVDHDLARLSGVGESRIERAIATLEDWGWLHWKLAPAGKRKNRRGGFIRKASQPVDRKDGRFQGRAAVRVWTEKFWADIGQTRALAEAIEKRAGNAAKTEDGKRVPVAPLVEQLAAALWDPTSAPRDTS